MLPKGMRTEYDTNGKSIVPVGAETIGKENRSGEEAGRSVGFAFFRRRYECVVRRRLLLFLRKQGLAEGTFDHFFSG